MYSNKTCSQSSVINFTAIKIDPRIMKLLYMGRKKGLERTIFK